MAFLKILFYLIVLIAVLVLAYYTTRMLGRGMGRTRGTGGMEILDQMALGRDSYLLVVKVQERIFLIGVSPGRISKVEELESYDKGFAMIRETAVIFQNLHARIPKCVPVHGIIAGGKKIVAVFN